MSILIGGAWPYANGSLHLGHLASLLPGDVIARYFRAKGEDVLYVSGSDCHGTPISLRAKKEGVPPRVITDKYHQEFVDCFNKLGFSYDLYFRTDDDFHKQEVQKIIIKLQENGFIYEQDVEQLYCENCQQFLPDRFVEGICPHCKNKARGDQCDNCSTLLEPLDLTERKCKICGSEPVVRSSKQLFFALSKFQKELEDYLQDKKDWRLNARKMSERYLEEGLQDRAISRDLPWGIDIPIEGFRDKKIYVWVEAVLGYLTASKKWAVDNNKDGRQFWSKGATAYYVHGKDNIPFHTLILPALLKGAGYEKLPDRIISSEYLTIEGGKISTSNNWAIWVPDVVNKYNPDALRYFLLINGPERRDTDFSWREFIHSNNGELLGAYGNLVNRTLVFVQKYFDNLIPEGDIDKEISEKILALYDEVGEKISQGELKHALEQAFEFIRSMNKYFDEKSPWLSIKENKEECKNTIYNCVLAIANIANLLSPFLPFSSVKIKKWLACENETWGFIKLKSPIELKEIDVLFERLDKSIIEEETKKLGK